MNNPSLLITSFVAYLLSLIEESYLLILISKISPVFLKAMHCVLEGPRISIGNSE